MPTFLLSCQPSVFRLLFASRDVAFYATYAATVYFATPLRRFRFHACPLLRCLMPFRCFQLVAPFYADFAPI